ncbi:MAG: MurR/RpiR family transcriptional regulator [Xanthomonadales bacterium]|jgi:RpiR family carbohydrate utilization transcriptional regulator|nr:MurR/RpiR family transcriptional regulator [Xanthomonadales bacterium]
MLDRLKQLRDQLSPAERRVADWILAHPREVLASNLADLASRAGTSEPTVVRLSRRAGAGGYSDLKLRLAEALSRPSTWLHRDVGPGDGLTDAVMKVMDRSAQALLSVRERIGTYPFKAAVPLMTGARQWIFCGLGASGSVAQDACHKFFRLGVPSVAWTDTPTMLQAASLAGPGDVLLVISHTGRWPRLAAAQGRALERNATVLAFTQSGSPMAEASTLCFPHEIDEDTSVYTPMSSRLAQLALLDALQVAVALALGEAAGRNLKASKLALDLA